MIYKDLVIVGGGAAGLNAAISAHKNGVRDILIIEQSNRLGGILNQCIHNGFGLHWFKEELTGPAFASKCIEELISLKIDYQLNATVTSINNDKLIEVISLNGYDLISAKSVIFSVGCYERNRGAISIPGYRPNGIFTAGAAQKYLNEEGYLVGKKVFILGSGDIGLIMARRMTLEGAKVLGVAEIMPYSNGLKRNIVQCLDDFEIPLFLSHTITNVFGKDNLEAIEISKVDKNFKPIVNSKKRIEVDTLLLSVGLIPDNNLIQLLDVEFDSISNRLVVDEKLNIGIPGIFACGNGLHVHDLVDFVAEEAKIAGESAASFIFEEKFDTKTFEIEAGQGLSYILPQKCHYNVKNVKVKGRVKKPIKKATIQFLVDDIIVKEINKVNLFPSEMLDLNLTSIVLNKVKNKLRVKVIENDE